MGKLSEYLEESYSVNNFKGEISRLAQALAMKSGNPRKQVLINGLIGLLLGVYCLNDKKIMELTREILGKYIELL
jgi:hypothetical protein